MARVGRFWICGEHAEPVTLAAEAVAARVAPPTQQQRAVIPPGLEGLPFPLALVLSELYSETRDDVRLHRLTDAAEMITRHCAGALLADLVARDPGPAKALQATLARGLARPTLGLWKQVLELAARDIGRRGAPFHPGLDVFALKVLTPCLGPGNAPPEAGLLALRNCVVHSNFLPDAGGLCRKMLQGFEPVLKAMSILAEVALVGMSASGAPVHLVGAPMDSGFPAWDGPMPAEAQPGDLFLANGTATLLLHPLQLVSPTDGRAAEVCPQVYFRVGRGGFLEYTALSGEAPMTRHRGRALDRFEALFPLGTWRRISVRASQAADPDQDALREDLQEVFVGRAAQLESLKQTLNGCESGVIWLRGKAGVGKSALMAALARNLAGAADRLLCLPWFFRSGRASCTVGRFLQQICTRLADTLDHEEEIPSDPEGLRCHFRQLLQQAATLDKKVILLVDGLDEILALDPSLADIIRGSSLPGVVWLCASREEPASAGAMQGAQEALAQGLPVLDADETRNMLVQHLGRLKYVLFDRDRPDRSNPVVETLVKRSGGLPLYIRIAVEDFVDRRMSLRDEDSLPEGLPAYYDEVLNRSRVGDLGSILTPIFCLLARAREPLTEQAIEALLGDHLLRTSDRWSELFTQALELGQAALRWERTGWGAQGWTLYHDSFRRHLLGAPATRETSIWAEKQLVQRCKAWPEQPEDLRRYSLRHLAAHLEHATTPQDLYALARDEAFARAQQEAYPWLPALQMETVRAALGRALSEQHAGQAAEQVIRAAAALMEMRQESPMDALKRGNMQRAWALASEADPDLVLQWKLLLVWHQFEQGDCSDEAKTWLHRLLEEHSPEPKEWVENVSQRALAVARIMHHCPEHYARLLALVPRAQEARVAVSLAHLGHHEVAVGLLEGLIGTKGLGRTAQAVMEEVALFAPTDVVEKGLHVLHKAMKLDAENIGEAAPLVDATVMLRNGDIDGLAAQADKLSVEEVLFIYWRSPDNRPAAWTDEFGKHLFQRCAAMHPYNNPKDLHLDGAILARVMAGDDEGAALLAARCIDLLTTRGATGVEPFRALGILGRAEDARLLAGGWSKERMLAMFVQGALLVGKTEEAYPVSKLCREKDPVVLATRLLEPGAGEPPDSDAEYDLILMALNQRRYSRNFAPGSALLPRLAQVACAVCAHELEHVQRESQDTLELDGAMGLMGLLCFMGHAEMGRLLAHLLPPGLGRCLPLFLIAAYHPELNHAEEAREQLHDELATLSDEQWLQAADFLKNPLKLLKEIRAEVASFHAEQPLRIPKITLDNRIEDLPGSLRPEGLQILASQLAASGSQRDVLRIVQTAESDELKQMMLMEGGEVILEEGRPEDAVLLVRTLEDLGGYMDLDAQLAIAAARHDQLDLAMGLCAKLTSGVGSVHSTEVLAELAVCHARRGDAHEAVITLARIRDFARYGPAARVMRTLGSGGGLMCFPYTASEDEPTWLAILLSLALQLHQDRESVSAVLAEEHCEPTRHLEHALAIAGDLRFPGEALQDCVLTMLKCDMDDEAVSVVSSGLVSKWFARCLWETAALGKQQVFEKLIALSILQPHVAVGAASLLTRLYPDQTDDIRQGILAGYQHLTRQ